LDRLGDTDKEIRRGVLNRTIKSFAPINMLLYLLLYRRILGIIPDYLCGFCKALY
jgi:hypothetical protein